MPLSAIILAIVFASTCSRTLAFSANRKVNANANDAVLVRSPLTSSQLSYSKSSTALYYVDERELDTSVTEVRTTITTNPSHDLKKPTIYPISSLQELHDFLEEDDRLTAIKFYAPWCKYCKQVGLRYQGLAAKMGDGVIDRRAVEGEVRFAAIEYGSLTAKLITEQLQVQGVPTLQLYKGTTKLWESKSSNEGHPNKTNTKVKTSHLKQEVIRLLDMTADELEDYVEDFEDDGILGETYEDSFFDNSECSW